MNAPIHSSRSLHVDIWRGSTCILMIFYHFCYDLDYLQLMEFDFYQHPFWFGLRTLIVSLFIGIVGISLHLATLHGLRIQALGKRLAILLACAGLTSFVSLILFQERFIFFGILHFIALASVVGLFFLRWFWINIISGISLLLIGLNVQHPWFDQNIWQWFGLVTTKPFTEDYVPFLPWFGMVLLGIALGKYLHISGIIYRPIRWGQRLAWLGRHSLLVYMLHQPILLGFLSGLVILF